MAQGKVTDFFSARKRNSSLQPSKRRKVELIATNVDISSLDKTNAKTAKVTEQKSEIPECEKTLFSPLQTRAARKAKIVPASTQRKTRTRKAKVDPKQVLISDSLICATQEKQGEVTLSESVTSSWDNHDAPPSTPQKNETKVTNTRKRTRVWKNEQKEIEQSGASTPEKQRVIKGRTKGQARKKLQVDSKPDTVTHDENVEGASGAESVAADIPVQESLPVARLPVSDKKTIVTEALEKCQGVMKVDPKKGPVNMEDIKNKLAKVGNLDDLKSRLAKMKETRQKISKPATPVQTKPDKVTAEVETPSDTKPKVPAYERFHHLATSAPPTLTLPYKYRLLVEHFRGMDQVVSMLHNRSELCTFSKLKFAVQELTKRNFHEKHVGQIKTVYPEAYELRQEKGVPNALGLKSAGYQLTVEARLQEEDKSNQRTVFKASHLLGRRNYFHSSLIKIVKQHHKTFLASLIRPLSIPDDKITRWHPKFPLDEVPDVPETALPQAPDVDKYQTAKDVLESTRGKLTPKVEAALRATAKINMKSEANTTPTSSMPGSSHSESKPALTQIKGVPMSLLEKIRAKEAANVAASLMRDPKVEKRITMMKRLPDVMRIIRSHFVTEKKPALPLESVIQRLLDSFKSCIAPGDVEPHINMCMEVAPEWISSVQIKKGKYIKIDRNIELQKLTDKVNNLVKTEK